MNTNQQAVEGDQKYKPNDLDENLKNVLADSQKLRANFKKQKTVIKLFIVSMFFIAVAAITYLLMSEAVPTSLINNGIETKVDEVIALPDSNERTEFLSYVQSVSDDGSLNNWEVGTIKRKHLNATKNSNANEAKANVTTISEKSTSAIGKQSN